jgi:hypothetical protein
MTIMIVIIIVITTTTTTPTLSIVATLDISLKVTCAKKLPKHHNGKSVQNATISLTFTPRRPREYRNSLTDTCTSTCHCELQDFRDHRYNYCNT